MDLLYTCTTSINKSWSNDFTCSLIGHRHVDKCAIVYIVHVNTAKKGITLLKKVIWLHVPYFTAEAPTCFDSYNQPRLGGGRLFEHAALSRGSAHLSQLAPCCPVAV